MNDSAAPRARFAIVTAWAMAVCLVVAAKSFYSAASAAQLTWLLTPPCWLARHLGGIDLVPEAGIGWISQSHHLIVGTACAGMNFLTVCFAMVFFATRSQRAWLGLCESVAIAYVATLAVNTLRIIAAAHLYDLHLPPGWLSPERLHRIAGTLIYCIGLALTFTATQKRAHLVVPLFFYLAIVLGLPLVHAALTHETLAGNFTEHALTVCAIVLGLAVVSRIPRLLARVTA